MQNRKSVPKVPPWAQALNSKIAFLTLLASPPSSWVMEYSPKLDPLTFQGKTTHMYKTLLLMGLFCLSISAKTIDIKDYATPNDGLNDRPGFQAAADELRTSGGGTLIISEGTWDIGDAAILFIGNYVSYKIVGDKGSIIRIASAPNFSSFEVGNANSFEMHDLVFIGGTNGVDTASILNADYTGQVLVKGCRVFGVYGAYALFYTSNVDAVYEGNQFDGSGSNVAVIAAGGGGFRSLTVRNNTFFDYANFNGGYYSKPGSTPAWIRVEPNNEQLVNAAWGSTVIIDNNRLDEGAVNAISIKNVRNLQIRNIAVNVSGTTPGAGILLDNVKYGSVMNSVFGYVQARRPALVLRNESNVEISKLDFGGGVYLGTFDRSSRLVPVGLCTGCSVKPLNGGGSGGESK